MLTGSEQNRAAVPFPRAPAPVARTGEPAFEVRLAQPVQADGGGFNRPTSDAMVAVFVDELTPLAVSAEISAASELPGDLGPTWVTCHEPRPPVEAT